MTFALWTKEQSEIFVTGAITADGYNQLVALVKEMNRYGDTRRVKR